MNTGDTKDTKDTKDKQHTDRMMSNYSILVVEDDMDIRELLTLCLRPLVGKQLYAANTGMEGLKLFRSHHPDLIVLDLKLPDIDGLSVCAKIKNEIQIKQPIIVMLTSRNTEKDHAIGYQVGADHYFTKPFDIVELRTCITDSLRNYTPVLKESHSSQNTTLQYKELQLDTSNLRLSIALQSIDLTYTEAKILETLMSNPRLAFTRRHLLNTVWHSPHPSSERTIDVHISSLRKKIAGLAPDSKSFIRSISRVGYSLE